MIVDQRSEVGDQTEGPGCACVALCAYDCWARRYGMGTAHIEDIEADGGPCECSCHDEECADADP